MGSKTDLFVLTCASVLTVANVGVACGAIPSCTNFIHEEFNSTPTKETKMKKLLLFKLKNETKGALRYDEINETTGQIASTVGSHIIGTIYLRKSAMSASKYPLLLKVELEWQD